MGWTTEKVYHDETGRRVICKMSTQKIKSYPIKRFTKSIIQWICSAEKRRFFMKLAVLNTNMNTGDQSLIEKSL